MPLIKQLLSHTAIRALLAVMVVTTYCGLAAWGKTVPGLEGIAGMVLGFFFKARPEGQKGGSDVP